MNPFRTALMLLAALSIGGAFGIASAKLPALNDEQKAKAAEAKAKAEEAGKKEAELLAKSQDRVVSHYKGAKTTRTSATAPAKK